MINSHAHLIPLILIVGGGIFLTIGDLTAKKWVVDGHHYFYIATLVLYMVAMNMLILSFQYKHIAVASLMMVLLNILLLIACSKYLWNESLTNQQLAGILLGMVSLVLLEWDFKGEAD